jgi:hypothetical protein
MRFQKQTLTLHTLSVVILWTSDRPITEQHSQETDILAPDGIRTRISSRRAAVDPRFIPHGHIDWPEYICPYFVQYTRSIPWILECHSAAIIT